MHCVFLFFFFFKQKTAYEMRISDWSSDVCSSDLSLGEQQRTALARAAVVRPRVLVADEPISHQNHEWAAAMMLLVADLAETGTACLQIGRASCRERVCQYV